MLLNNCKELKLLSCKSHKIFTYDNLFGLQTTPPSPSFSLFFFYFFPFSFIFSFFFLLPSRILPFFFFFFFSFFFFLLSSPTYLASSYKGKLLSPKKNSLPFFKHHVLMLKTWEHGCVGIKTWEHGCVGIKTWEHGCVGDPMSPTFFILIFIFLIIFLYF